MSIKSSIEWTGSTWTPIRAKVKADAVAIARSKGYASLIQIAERMVGHVGPHCERVSPGCGDASGGGCYSEANNHRCLPSNGTGLPFDRRSRDLVDIFLDEKILRQPLTWRHPRMIFVCSQTDLFGEFVPDEAIDRVFAVMALCPQHTFQVLTKRADRMLAYLTENHGLEARRRVQDVIDPTSNKTGLEAAKLFDNWPLRNVWCGCSVENQEYADKRIPLLLDTPAAIRFVSYEPALGPVDFDKLELLCKTWRKGFTIGRYLDWIIVGGESGPGARRFDIAWARTVIEQCKYADTAVFVKQLGAKPYNGCGEFEHQALTAIALADRKGGSPDEWPADLRVRQFPTSHLAEATV